MVLAIPRVVLPELVARCKDRASAFTADANQDETNAWRYALLYSPSVSRMVRTVTQASREAVAACAKLKPAPTSATTAHKFRKLCFENCQLQSVCCRASYNALTDQVKHTEEQHETFKRPNKPEEPKSTFAVCTSIHMRNWHVKDRAQHGHTVCLYKLPSS